MDTNITEERLTALFSTHPAVDVFFITADGSPFFDLPGADSHAQRLKEKHILEITREDVEAGFIDGTEVSAEDLTEQSNPALAAALATFQNEGEIDHGQNGGVIVPPSNILAGEAIEPEPEDEPEPETEAEPTRDELMAKYKELFGKSAMTFSNDKLKAAIAEAVAKKAADQQ